MPATADPDAKPMLDLAARAAARGMGRVEPNPMVGCVIVRAAKAGETHRPARERLIGIGHHRVFGGPHAEVDAIESAKRQGHAGLLAGATAYVTLEPCNHHGKQPPCTDALIRERIGRVVFARPDPNPLAAGGAARLRAAGIACEESPVSAAALALSDPFVKRVRTDLPWVVAKWAQTIDGRIATRTGQSQWISGERSRRCVHALRGRVDAIFTGIGTVIADDPLLTPRGVHARRTPLRVVIDPDMALSPESRLARTARESPVLAVHCAGQVAAGLHTRSDVAARLAALDAAGVHRFVAPQEDGLLGLRATLRHLRAAQGVATVMVEGGAGLLGRLVKGGLIDQALVFTGPLVLGDTNAPGPVRGLDAATLAAGQRWTLEWVRSVGGDVLAAYRTNAE
ncbi:MAG: bifunctional diaminohydroxyphosphoribosylaminopyrimidine deaminase/5-amino-6-(5-phosphoribosylamino)uracil reductase RibD [Chloroflexi bacterium]|nr:bifunctional diaminohydroxyphosphoribosylaminopyrimidine deaminase/5-amino-6-(5-phosphoribosylamino)uracil reductase RibD [Chloroflexota bacterium]